MLVLLKKVINKLDVIFRYVISVINFIFYFILNRISKKKIEDHADIVISLTSFSKRLNLVYLTIESVFRQKCASKYEVHLYLSKLDITSSGLPNSLKRLEDRGLKIFIVDENIKSYKKLFYSSLYNESKPIITIDDDIFYPSYWLNKLLMKAALNPNSVIAYRGHNITFKDSGILNKYSDFIQTPIKKINGANFMPTGVSGVFYPIGSLKGLNEEQEFFLKLCPNADDIWFKFKTIRNGFDSILVGDKSVHFISIPSSQNFSLRKFNLDESGNDIQLKNALDHFPEVYDILKNSK
ncbi:hypothetical protein [Tatumella sp. OPLPL6]|uniref:hypothetical protein n=1 Tax=Tatumella sp. OPLPL6 TaxID=1928657 RepID=UPI000C184701|nr:hypothetical protein [Tatumella sp. OPLPL6]PIJ41838.1 hypothetical protein BOM24_13765 [Tatumella sp. OPLPL6]